MWKKIFTALQVLALIAAVAGGWGLALNQFASFLSSGKQVGIVDLQRQAAERQLKYLELQEQRYDMQERATAECLLFGAPRAIVIKDKVFCVVTWYGSEQIASLEYLQKNYGKQP